MNDTKPGEPLLIIKRARRFYGPFYSIVKILQFYIAIVFIMLDKPYAPIVGWVMLIGLFYAEIIPNCFKFIACYDDRIVVKYFFWEKIIMLTDIKEFTAYKIPISFKQILAIRLKPKIYDILIYLGSISIPMDYIASDDFEKLKILLKERNVRYFNFKNFKYE